MNKRIYEYDIIRTIATFSVVFVHVSAIAIALYIPNSFQSNFMILMNRLLKFTTPVFLYLAGALIYESNKKRSFDYRHFLTTRGKRILIPYIFVSTMYFLFIVGYKHLPVTMGDYFEQLLTGSAEYHLYFIPIIIQLYLLTPVFLFLKNRFKREHVLVILTVISFICVLILKFKYSDRIFLKYMAPYLLGLYYGSDIISWIKNLGSKKYLVLGLTGVSGLYYAFTFSGYIQINNWNVLNKLQDTGWFIYCLVSCVFLTMLGMSLVKFNPIRKIASVLSKISYYIYLLHPLFIFITGIILTKLRVRSISIRFVLQFLIVVIVSTLVAYLIKGVPYKRLYNMLNRLQKVLVLSLAIIIFGSSGLVAYGLLADRGYLPTVKTFAYTNQVKQYADVNEDASYIYENKKFGYAFDYAHMSVDDENEYIRTTFTDPHTTVDVYYENFSGTIHHAAVFTDYGNESIVDSDYVSVKENVWLRKDGYQVHLLKWERQPLKYIKNDRRYYATMDIIKNSMEVYNITISSDQPVDPLRYLARFSMIDIDASAGVKRQVYHQVDNESWSEETSSYYHETFIDSDQVEWGIFEPTSVWGLDTLHGLENEIDHQFDMLLQYYDLEFPIDEANIQQIYDEGRVLEFTLQTTVYGEFDPDFLLDVMNGMYDDELDVIVDKVSKIDGPVLFRLNNEMNGDWCLYNAYWFQKDTRIYTAFWKHLYEKFEAKGADNLIWIFNPNEMSFPAFKWNHYSNYFPGEDYVDVLGVTGYNTGNFYYGETWRDFRSIYDEFMPEYDEIFPDYPKMITEFGSSTIGGNKDEWVEDMFEAIREYDLKAAIYWNGTDYTADGGEARIYRFEDDPTVIDVFRKYLNIE